MEQLGWQVIQCQMQNAKCQIFIKHVPILGNIAKLQRPTNIPTTKEIDKIAGQYKIAAFYVEPAVDLRFERAKSSFIPAKTIQIDLAKSEKELLSEMKPKTRYNIKVAQKRGVIIEASHNTELALKRSPSESRPTGRSGIESFVALWHSSARQRGMFLGQKKEIKAMFKAFGPRAHLLLAYESQVTSRESPVAGVLLVRSATTTYYMYAASTKTGNKLFAPTLLVWEAIKLAKSARCKIFDFEGIYDERYKQTKNWKGFTKFKEGFGGKIITYPGTFVKYYNPLAKLLRL
ncbi:MAG: peptidoglycan bridge formation glycyltransferase FemA/FemB family protein [bacterium]|nr:peptidoglycan bridge formation glycyltransferase FemA/FemB family protein [bacterium]